MVTTRATTLGSPARHPPKSTDGGKVHPSATQFHGKRPSILDIGVVCTRSRTSAMYASGSTPHALGGESANGKAAGGEVDKLLKEAVSHSSVGMTGYLHLTPEWAMVWLRGEGLQTAQYGVGCIQPVGVHGAQRLASPEPR
ncbi:MAG: hypothetical protein EXR77_19195 [Myxococcales bacterium]|nr:hypothetical protein [Myxococcales bacterium]